MKKVDNFKDFINEDVSEKKSDKYTHKEMLQRTKAREFPGGWSILDIIERYDEHVIGYLKENPTLESVEVNEYQANTKTPYFRELVSGMEGVVGAADYKKLLGAMDKLLDDWYAEGYDKGQVLQFFNAIIPAGPND